MINKEIKRLNQYNASFLNFYNIIERANMVVINKYIGLSKNLFIILISLCGIFLGLVFSILRYSYNKYK